VVQLYLLEKGHAKEAKTLIVDLDGKYKVFLDKDVKKQIPAWKIEADIRIATPTALKEAVQIWDAWQQREMATNGKPSTLLVKTTQNLANKGIKAWLKLNKDDPQKSFFESINTRISKWITQNVKTTPMLLVQLALVEDQGGRWSGVIDYSELFIEKLASDSQWKSNSDYQKDIKKFKARMYLLRAKAYQNLKTLENYQKATQAWNDLYRISPNSRYLRNRADSFMAAGDLASGPRKKEFYAQAVQIYNNLRKKSAAYKEGGAFYWKSLDLILQCRYRMKEFETCFDILLSHRFQIVDSDQNRKKILDWLDKIFDQVSSETQKNIQNYRKNIEQDKQDFLKTN
jgi:tetratricopeptide (TPR) repeat protein